MKGRTTREKTLVGAPESQPESALQNTGGDTPRKAEEWDPPVVGTHLLVALIEGGDHHPSLALHECRPGCPRCPWTGFQHPEDENTQDRSLGHCCCGAD